MYTRVSRECLSFVASKLSQYFYEPMEEQCVTVKHVLRYRRGTANTKLCFRRNDSGIVTLFLNSNNLSTSGGVKIHNCMYSVLMYIVLVLYIVSASGRHEFYFYKFCTQVLRLAGRSIRVKR